MDGAHIVFKLFNDLVWLRPMTPARSVYALFFTEVPKGLTFEKRVHRVGGTSYSNVAQCRCLPLVRLSRSILRRIAGTAPPAPALRLV